MRLLKLALASVGCLALLAACADASSSTRNAFIAKADAICQKFKADDNALAATLTANSTEADFVKLIKEKVVPLFKKQTADIRALGFPEADKAELGRLMDDSDKLADEIAADPVKYLNNTTDPFAEIGSALQAYGMKECGVAASTTTAPASPSTT